MIVKQGRKWFVKSDDGKQTVLGEYDNITAATEQQREIALNKKIRDDNEEPEKKKKKN